MSYRKPTEFTVTENHIKLLRRAYVDWNEEYYDGAPFIGCKRPYGNSWVVGDIAEIIGFKSEVLTDKDDQTFTAAEEKMLLDIHRGTEYALQIFLVTGEMKPGTYVQGEYELRGWKLKEEK